MTLIPAVSSFIQLCRIVVQSQMTRSKACPVGSSSRLMDNSEHIESSDCYSILSSLSLQVVEVAGHGENDGVGNGASEVNISGLLHL